MTGQVCVVITARNAQDTLADAVTSALAQPEVSELVVVDDASTDDTSATAHRAAAGDTRLRVLRQETNIGPAAGRNLAIAHSSAPYLAILDADDYLLPGRFARLLAQSGWDLIADNIVFVPDDEPGMIGLRSLPMIRATSRKLELGAFVTGNLSQGRTQRGELGFLKPMMSRQFLQKHDLTYDPGLWLGEDYDLYVRMLLNGGRFMLNTAFGYVARVRHNSLSGQHKTADLAALMAASARHAVAPAMTDADRKTIRRHHDQIQKRYLLRAFLDKKAAVGLGPALGFAMAPLSNLPPIALGVLRDKLQARGSATAKAEVARYLLPTDV